MNTLFRALILVALAPSSVYAQVDKPREWIVDGVKRQAIIKLPVKKGAGPVPVIFGLHGHGGSMHNYARHDLQKYWPEALIVSPQGLPTPGKTDPKGERSGWQKEKGDQKDRDLHFIDAILKTLHEDYQIDDQRIYVTGHSNGGGFTYLLWATRSQVFAAYAPCAAGMRYRTDLPPAPVFHLAGEKDPVVPFENQKRSMEAVKKNNQCESEGKEWAPRCKLYTSKVGAPFISYIHPGNHKYPDEANKLIVRFFQENPKRNVDAKR